MMQQGNSMRVSRGNRCCRLRLIIRTGLGLRRRGVSPTATSINEAAITAAALSRSDVAERAQQASNHDMRWPFRCVQQRQQ